MSTDLTTTPEPTESSATTPVEERDYPNAYQIGPETYAVPWVQPSATPPDREGLGIRATRRGPGRERWTDIASTLGEVEISGSDDSTRLMGQGGHTP